MQTLKLAILFSGNGSNMQNLIQSLHQKIYCNASKQEVKLEIALSLCNNPKAYGITRAENLGIPCEIISHKDFSSRLAFDQTLIRTLESYQIDLCLLAGFMRILTSTFTQKFKTINIHPSLLPAHKGTNAIAKTFSSGDKCGGVSVHWVDEDLDSGKLIAQESVCILSDDTLESFEQKIHTLEHKLYPLAVLKALELMPLEDSQ